MTMREQDGNAPRPETASRAHIGDSHELFVFRAGDQWFAVFAEEAETTAENLHPAPLPFAPPAVLGVVPVRGRMRTALDPLLLLDAPALSEVEAPAPPAVAPPMHGVTSNQARLFVALAGDEQLALACDSAEDPVTVHASQLDFAPDSHAPVRGRVEHDGRAITLLDPARLFDAAMRGTDRRRRRS